MNFNRTSFLFSGIFFVALLLQLLNFRLFTRTMIPLGLLISFYLLGIIAYFIFRKRISKVNEWLEVSNFIFCFIVVGSFLNCLFLGLNYTLAEKSTQDRKFDIIDRTTFPGGKYNRSNEMPVVFIKTDENRKKAFLLKEKYEEDINRSTQLELNLSRGFFNYTIIREIYTE